MTLCLSHGTCGCIRMYIYSIADSVVAYLQRGLHNITFKIKHKLYVASGSAPPPPDEKFWVRTCDEPVSFPYHINSYGPPVQSRMYSQ
jgi:hypothetical protein